MDKVNKLVNPVKLKEELNAFEKVSGEEVNKLSGLVILEYDGSIDSVIALGLLIAKRLKITLLLKPIGKFDDQIDYILRVQKRKFITYRGDKKIITPKILKVDTWSKFAKWLFIDVFALAYSKYYDRNDRQVLNYRGLAPCTTKEEGFLYTRFPFNLKVIAAVNWGQREWENLKKGK